MKLTAIILAVIPYFMFCQNREADSIILVDIYNQLNGPNWINSDNWLTSAPLETWNGIKISENRVSELNLTNRKIAGKFPENVYELDALKKLKFFSGELSGNLSHKLYQLKNLRELTIANCGLSGMIPTRLDSLPDLERLDLSRNNFDGPLPQLPYNLEKLDIRQNNLTGSIPMQYAELPMWQIDVSSNKLTGSLEIVSNWEFLDGFKGSFNNWDEQPLPDWLDDLPMLRSFVCTECNLIGEIPKYDWSQNKSFYQLIVANNLLNGDITQLPMDTIGGRQWPWLDLTNNNISGELATHKIKNINRLWLNNNNIDKITTFNYDKLYSIRLANNELTLSSLIDEFPKIINDDGISNYFIAGQRSPLDNEKVEVKIGETLEIAADDIISGSSYQWYYNSTLMNGEVDEVLKIEVLENQQAGKYWCEVSHPTIIDNDGEIVSFKGKEWEVSIKSSTHTNEVDNENRLFPNPTQDIVYISGEVEDGTYQVLQMTGQVLLQGKIAPNQCINIAHLRAGTYTLNVISDKKQWSSLIYKM